MHEDRAGRWPAWMVTDEDSVNGWAFHQGSTVPAWRPTSWPMVGPDRGRTVVLDVAGSTVRLVVVELAAGHRIPGGWAVASWTVPGLLNDDGAPWTWSADEASRAAGAAVAALVDGRASWSA